MLQGDGAPWTATEGALRDMVLAILDPCSGAMVHASTKYHKASRVGFFQGPLLWSWQTTNVHDHLAGIEMQVNHANGPWASDAPCVQSYL